MVGRPVRRHPQPGGGRAPSQRGGRGGCQAPPPGGLGACAAPTRTPQSQGTAQSHPTGLGHRMRSRFRLATGGPGPGWGRWRSDTKYWRGSRAWGIGAYRAQALLPGQPGPGSRLWGKLSYTQGSRAGGPGAFFSCWEGKARAGPASGNWRGRRTTGWAKGLRLISPPPDGPRPPR